MKREKTTVPKEKPSKPQREKTMGIKREKTMGLTRQKTVLNDKSLKGKMLIKTMSKEHLSSSPSLKSSLNAILLGSTSVDLPSTAKIVRIFTSSTFKGGFTVRECHYVQLEVRKLSKATKDNRINGYIRCNSIFSKGVRGFLYVNNLVKAILNFANPILG